MATTPFQLISFDGVILQGEATSISVPTPDGEITILPHHVPLVSSVMPGEAKITIVEEDGKLSQEYVAVGAGFVEVTTEGVTLLTRTAEALAEIDEERVRQAIATAEARLKELASMRILEDDREIAETSAQLARNIARLGVVKRRRRGV